MVQAKAVPVMTDEFRDNDGEDREFSAGGVVVKDSRVLIVRVRNLKGDLLWTFPKGHVEKGETAREAACREVEEETGYRCRALGAILTARYQFMRSGRLIKKRVQWYWMEAGGKLGKPDGAEIVSVQWVSLEKAEGMLRYPSDKRLLERTKSRFARPARAETGRAGEGG